MNTTQRRNYWLKTERLRKALENKYAKEIEQVLRRQRSSLIDGNITSQMVELWNRELLEVYTRMFRESYLLFARLTYNSLKNVKFVGMGQNEAWTQAVNEWLAMNGLKMVSTISGNSRDLLLSIVNQTIQDGIRNGWGTEEVTREIVRRLGDEGYTYDSYRARRIARTETVRASNMGHMAGAKSLPFETIKVWISAKDDRTRRVPRDEYDHWVLDGQRIDFETPFKAVSKEGVEIEAQQPGDDTAPAGFTINCRCRVAFEGKRDENGKLIMKNQKIRI